MNNNLVRLHLNGDSGFFQILAVRGWMDVMTVPVVTSDLMGQYWA